MAGTVKALLGSNSDKDDVHEENGVLFWVNRSGFPMDDRTWDRMWEHVARLHPEGIAMTKKIRNQAVLPQVLTYVNSFETCRLRI